MPLIANSQAECMCMWSKFILVIIIHEEMGLWKKHAPSVSKENSGLCGTMFPWDGFASESCAGVTELWSGMDIIKDKSELNCGDNHVSNTGFSPWEDIRLMVFR